MSHILDWNAAVELPVRHLHEKTPPIFDQLRGLFSGIGRPVRRHSFSATLGARHMLLQEHTKGPNDVYAIRGKDVRHRFNASKNCISSPAFSWRLMVAKPGNRSGSCLSSPCKYTFPHHVMLFSKNV